MRYYSIYFEFYGRKMKAKILAESMIDAQNQIKSKINFHKVEKDENEEFNKCMDMIDSAIDLLDKSIDRQKKPGLRRTGLFEENYLINRHKLKKRM